MAVIFCDSQYNCYLRCFVPVNMIWIFYFLTVTVNVYISIKTAEYEYLLTEKDEVRAYEQKELVSRHSLRDFLYSKSKKY